MLIQDIEHALEKNHMDAEKYGDKNYKENIGDAIFHLSLLRSVIGHGTDEVTASDVADLLVRVAGYHNKMMRNFI